MGSDLMIFGAWTLPRGALPKLRAATLSYPAHAHAEGSMARAFAAPSGAKKVSAVLAGAKKVERFLRLEQKASALHIHGVLADDDWYDACARLGAVARAAAALGAKGHLTCLSDGQPAGRLVLMNKTASFVVSSASARRSASDAEGEAEVRRMWDELDAPSAKPAKSAQSTAAERALAKRWAAAELKYRATWFKGKPEAYIVQQLVQLKADFELGARAAVARKQKATR